VAAGAGIDEAGGDAGIPADERGVADTVVGQRSEALPDLELALEDLAPAPDRSKRIAPDGEDRRVGRELITPPRANLLCERLVDCPARDRRSDLRDVLELRHCGPDDQRHRHHESNSKPQPS